MEQLKTHSNVKSEKSFYKVVVKNARWRELWRLTRPKVFEFAMGGFVKLFRIDLPVAHAFGPDLVQLDLTEVPGHITAHFAKEQRELTELGFTGTFAFTIPVLGNGENFALVFQHRDEDRIAGLIYHRLEQNGVTEFDSGIAISSRSEGNGHIYTTINMAKRLDSPEGPCRLEVVSLDSATEINARHSARLQTSGGPWEHLRGKQVWQLLEDCHKLEMADQLERKVITKISEEEWISFR